MGAEVEHTMRLVDPVIGNEMKQESNSTNTGKYPGFYNITIKHITIVSSLPHRQGRNIRCVKGISHLTLILSYFHWFQRIQPTTWNAIPSLVIVRLQRKVSGVIIKSSSVMYM